jgi:UDP-GlcNAc:undecaprenyl-phosphate GlcNAc-1-phosphate transferase
MEPTWIATLVITAGVISFSLTLVVRALAPHVGLTDCPDGHRKLHRKPMPLGGGLAVYVATAALLIGLLIASNPYRDSLQHFSRWILGMLAAAGAMVVLGLLDDRFSLRGRHKLLGQILIVLCLALNGLAISRVSLFGWECDLGPLTIPFTVFWLLGAINAINLLDGMDGMVTVLGTILAGTFAVLAVVTGRYEVAAVALTFTGALLGFLCFNLPPASIFLGDAGSMLIGLLLGILAIKGSMKGAGTVLLAAPMAILTLPILDSTAAILRRKLTGRSIYATDRGHLHHCLMDRLGSNSQVLCIVGACCLITSAAAMLSVCWKNDFLALAVGLGVVGLLIATGLFGRAESALVFNRLRSLLRSFLNPRAQLSNQVRQTSVHLQGSAEWTTIWDTLTESAEKLSIWRMHLNVNMPLVHEGFNAIWERKGSDGEDNSWRLDLPLIVDDQAMGELRVLGVRNGKAPQADIVVLLDLVETCQSYLRSIAKAKVTAKRSLHGNGKQRRRLRAHASSK